MAKNLSEKTFTVTDKDLLSDGDPGTSYTLRRLTREKHRETRKAHTESTFNKRTHQKEDKIDWEAVTDALIDYVILAWTGVLYDGQPAPCDLRHKMLLDAPTCDAILERAGMNDLAADAEEVEAVKAASFRES